MKPNIFALGLVPLGLEDQVTAYWHYVINAVPGLGQSFVDEVCRISGLKKSTFLGAIDHPAGNRDNHPDLLLQCGDYSILFEHKLDSPVGPRQLERYLDLARAKKWKLAVLAARRIAIPDEVRQSPAFVYPTGLSRPSHFLWQDVEPIVGESRHPLAAEFCEYLELLGLGKFGWAGLGNPFVDEGAAAAMRNLYDGVRSVLGGPGVACFRSANSLIYQVRKPFPPIHLINIGPLESVAQEVPTLRGPVMGLWVWVRRAKGRDRVLRKRNGLVRGTPFPVHIADNEEPRCLPYERQVFDERSYYAPLEEILRPSLVESKDRLVAFVEMVVRHLRDEVVLRNRGA